MSQQLVKKGTNGKHVNVMPKSWIEAIKDKNTGQTLVEILQGFNMYFLSYTGNVAETRRQVPAILRKKGLWITYVKYDGSVHTEWYAANETDDKSWGDSSNWRIGNNTLVGDITISANGNWVINGTETEFKAVGEKGNTPLIRVDNNRLQVSYDLGDTYMNVTENPVYTQFRNHNNKIQVSTDLGDTWTDASDEIAAYFRWQATSGDTQANNVGRVQISRDTKTWTNLSNDIINNLHVSRYIGVNESLPTSGIAEGTIYAKGPYYDEGDTSNSNPIYRLWVYAWKDNTLAWQDNGEFTSIAAGVVQETGDSETEVMSQKAVTEKLSELESVGGMSVKKGESLLPLSYKYENTRVNEIGFLVEDSGYFTKIVPVTPNTSLHIRCLTGAYSSLWALDKNKYPISNLGANFTEGDVTTPSDARYILLPQIYGYEESLMLCEAKEDARGVADRAQYAISNEGIVDNPHLLPTSRDVLSFVQSEDSHIFNKIENVVIKNVSKIEIYEYLNPIIRLYSEQSHIYFYTYSNAGKLINNTYVQPTNGYFDIEVPYGQNVVLDSKSNSLIITNEEEAAINNGCILLAHADAYKITCGFLFEEYNRLRSNLSITKGESISAKVNSFNGRMTLPESLQVDISSTRYQMAVYFRFDGQFAIEGDVYNVIDFQQLKEQIGEEYWSVDSNSGIMDCVYIPSNHDLSYNRQQGKYIICPYGGSRNEDVILILGNRSGCISGVLADIYNQQVLVGCDSYYDYMPDYIEKEVADTESRALSAENDDNFNFLMATDTHSGEAIGKYRCTTHTLVDKVYKDINADAIVHLGDMIQFGNGSKVDGLRVLTQTINRFSDKTNLYMAVGNHDYNGISNGQQNTSFYLSHHDIYGLMGRHQRNNVVWGDKDGMYYYKDFEAHKIRLIVLNTHLMPETTDADGNYIYNSAETSGINQAQLEWLCKVALDSTPQDYCVVIATHVSLQGNSYEAASQFMNFEYARQILEAYINGGSVNISKQRDFINAIWDIAISHSFASKGKRSIIGCFAGHEHYDEIVSINGITYVTTICGGIDRFVPHYKPESADYKVGLFYYAFDFVSIDTRNKQVSLIRFGVGKDRVFSW